MGENHPLFATSLNNLAELYRDAGDYARAEPLYRQAAEVMRAAVGELHPYYAHGLGNLALLWAATGRADEAFRVLRQAAAVDDLLIRQLFSFGSDRQRAAFLFRTKANLEVFLSLVWFFLAGSSEAVGAALEMVLRRKAIRAEADAVRRHSVLAGAYPHLESHLQQFDMLSGQIARKSLAGPGPEGVDVYRRQLDDWAARREELERALALEIPEISREQQGRAADRRTVALALPEDFVLIEFCRYEVFNFQARPARGEHRRGAAHYLAFVLLACEPDRVAMVDLGEADPIDALIDDFRRVVAVSPRNRSLGAPQPDDPTDDRIQASGQAPSAAGMALRAAVFDGLVSSLCGRRRLLLSPDGGLTRLPFAVLPTDDGRLLTDLYQISYVGSGRDVLRFGTAVTGRATDPIVVCDPDFELGSAGAHPWRSRTRLPIITLRIRNVTVGISRGSKGLLRRATLSVPCSTSPPATATRR